MTEFTIQLIGGRGTLLIDGRESDLFGELVGCDIRHDVPADPADAGRGPFLKPQRDRAPDAPAAGPLSADAIDRAMHELWNSRLYAPPYPAPPPGSTSTGLFDALGGIRPGHGNTDRVLDWALRTDEAANGPLGRATWAPKDCICPWPWPTVDGHVRLDCPHYTAPATSPRGRNTRIGCQRYESGTIVHGDPHTCAKWERGH